MADAETISPPPAASVLSVDETTTQLFDRTVTARQLNRRWSHFALVSLGFALLFVGIGSLEIFYSVEMGLFFSDWAGPFVGFVPGVLFTFLGVLEILTAYGFWFCEPERIAVGQDGLVLYYPRSRVLRLSWRQKRLQLRVTDARSRLRTGATEANMITGTGLKFGFSVADEVRDAIFSSARSAGLAVQSNRPQHSDSEYVWGRPTIYRIFRAK